MFISSLVFHQCFIMMIYCNLRRHCHVDYIIQLLCHLSSSSTIYSFFSVNLGSLAVRNGYIFIKSDKAELSFSPLEFIISRLVTYKQTACCQLSCLTHIYPFYWSAAHKSNWNLNMSTANILLRLLSIDIKRKEKCQKLLIGQVSCSMCNLNMQLQIVTGRNNIARLPNACITYMQGHNNIVVVWCAWPVLLVTWDYSYCDLRCWIV